MIYVGGVPFSTPSSSSQESGMLDALLEHPILVSAADSFRDIPERKVSEEFDPERSARSNCVYVFQREYATVDPSLVDLVGTDEATTCVGLVIRNRQSKMTSVAHMDFPEVVDIGLNQMLSLVANNSDAVLDVHLIGSFEDTSPNHADHNRMDGYSFSLCSKVVETLQKSGQKFHLQNLFVLRHNTRRDSEGNAHPIVKGFLPEKKTEYTERLGSAHTQWNKVLLAYYTGPKRWFHWVKTSTGSVFPASFDITSRVPDEIIRRIRVGASFEDPSRDGKLLETYDTQTDRFIIAQCSWTIHQLRTAKTLRKLSDSEILLICSTSPSDEDPDFVNNERRKWEYLIQHPDWRETFPRKQPRIFERTDDDGWGYYWWD